MTKKNDLGKESAALLKPWLERIKDKSLREAVTRTFALALTKSGYKSAGDLKKIPFSLLVDCKGVSFIDHTLAVTHGAYHLAEAQMKHFPKLPYKINMDRLIAGALLHDVGKILEIEPDGRGGFRKSRNGKLLRHPMSGLVAAAEAGCPDEILNIIGCHAREGEGAPKVIETIFIHQADFATFDPLVMLEKGTLVQENK